MARIAPHAGGGNGVHALALPVTRKWKDPKRGERAPSSRRKIIARYKIVFPDYSETIKVSYTVDIEDGLASCYLFKGKWECAGIFHHDDVPSWAQPHPHTSRVLVKAEKLHDVS